MTDPAAEAARAAAAILAGELGGNLPAEVEVALAGRGGEQRAERYFDPVSLAGLIVAIATLAWTIYNDQRKRIPGPPASAVAREVRITLRERDVELPAGTERITEVVATEIIRLDRESGITGSLRARKALSGETQGDVVQGGGQCARLSRKIAETDGRDRPQFPRVRRAVSLSWQAAALVLRLPANRSTPGNVLIGMDTVHRKGAVLQ
jgi:hypothetical protein